MDFPEPVISVAIEPKTKADQEKMGMALQQARQEDPSFRVRTDEESGQTIISGMGELHLEIIVDRMKREFKVEANVGKPQVAYRETIRRRSSPKASSCASPAVAASTVTSCCKIEPQPRPASRLRVRQRHRRRRGAEGVHPGGRQGYPRKRWPTACSPASRSSTSRSRCRRFVPRRRLERNGVQDRRFDGLQGRLRKAKPVLLEPIMKVEVVTPEEYMGDVIGDLSRRRGVLQGMDDIARGQGHRAEGAAGRDVRLRDRPALDEPGSRHFTMEFATTPKRRNVPREEVIKRS
jgi:elongation factor G